MALGRCRQSGFHPKRLREGDLQKFWGNLLEDLLVGLRDAWNGPANFDFSAKLLIS